MKGFLWYKNSYCIYLTFGLCTKTEQSTRLPAIWMAQREQGQALCRALHSPCFYKWLRVSWLTFLFSLVFWDSVLLCSPGWPGTHRDSPSSASRVLGLRVHHYVQWLTLSKFCPIFFTLTLLFSSGSPGALLVQLQLPRWVGAHHPVVQQPHTALPWGSPVVYTELCGTVGLYKHFIMEKLHSSINFWEWLRRNSRHN